MDYKDTLNLPKTDFPMKAQLAQREPERLKAWDRQGLNAQIAEKNRDRPLFLLHDGPPYANGHIHFGHILNKILKDIIVKYRNMAGFNSPYLPGWDCHGLPIEHQVDKDLGVKKKDMSKAQIRTACREYALRFVKIQREEFKRLGIFGDWEHPYLTMDYAYEATIAREFARFVENGAIYKGKKPVQWCPSCRTALAEAEVEYEEHSSPSIYVSFPLSEDALAKLPELNGRKAAIVIWTTTPWTLPANLAVALHPHYDYVACEAGALVYIVANNRLEELSKILGWQDVQVLKRFSGSLLERTHCEHPFLPRSSLLVLSDHVTMDTGSGCVHIAPGHGEEDYLVGGHYGLPVLAPVDDAGRFTADVGLEALVGQPVTKANQWIGQHLTKLGHLLHEGEIQHSYPVCWRCKKPVVFRATAQWFLSLEKGDLRNKALDQIRRTRWIPDWGRERIYGMITSRPDWCLSRQRSWGVPIMALECKDCGEVLLDPALIREVATLIEQEGADLWFDESRPLWKKPPTCPKCKSQSLRRETDILDVWFDSGVSYAAVVEGRMGFQVPADLYLEGSDQHRGWFHSSLLAAVGTRGKAPYQAVLTHGFVVDGEGRKYSKSAKNYVPPDKVIKELGTEILRLWVAAEDYRGTISVSDQIFKGLSDAYRKIRNTLRFLLGNLYDFNPETDHVAAKDLTELDRYALHLLQRLVGRVKSAYEEYSFHTIFHELSRFCTVDLSAFYLDILKDRLYTTPAKSTLRRAAQTVLFELVQTLTPLLAPILCFTAEEVWEYLPAFPGKAASIHLADFPDLKTDYLSDQLARPWKGLRLLRDEVMKVLEGARKAKQIGNALEAKVKIFAAGEVDELLEQYQNQLAEIFIVSQVDITHTPPEGAVESSEIPDLKIAVVKADGEKCERCWKWTTSVGKDPRHPTTCYRCAQALVAA